MSSASVSVQISTVAALAVFSVLMIAIGFRANKLTKTIDDFLLGGRKIGAWMSAFAYGTSYFSAVIFIGYAGKNGWDVGLASLWIGVGNALLGCLLAWLVLAKKTRRMTHNLDAKTMPEFFQGRYGSNPMKIYSAIIIFIFLVPYSSAVYKGLGSMFNTIFPNISVNVCMMIVAVITAAFLVMGGYVAAVHTDFVQGLIMIFGTVVMILLLAFHPQAGGFGAIFEKLRNIDPQLVSPTGGANWRFLLTNILLTSFGTWGLPQMISKYYAVKDGKDDIKIATVVSTAFALLIGMGAYFVGSTGRIFLNNELPAAGYDAVVPNTLLTALGGSSLFSNFVLALIMVLLLSASMSTLSAIVLTSSSAVTVDLLPSVAPVSAVKNQLRWTRGLCLVFVALSYIFATMKFAIIVSIMSFSWGVVAGSFIGPYILGLYWKRVTKAGAWAGMLGGGLTIGLFTLFKTMGSGFPAAIAEAPMYGVLAMAASVALTAAVSLFTAELPRNIVNRAFNELKVVAK